METKLQGEFSEMGSSRVPCLRKALALAYVIFFHHTIFQPDLLPPSGFHIPPPWFSGVAPSAHFAN
ncbi:hypothetical protein QG37_07831 [Candidozyma auris]|nr:hypothetical protein QG37_07831 [[Candida] auris]